MQNELALQISDQLAQIATQLVLIREALEKYFAQQGHQYTQTKRY